MPNFKDYQEVIDHAEEQGWRVRKTEGNHMQLFAPDGKSIVVCPTTPSDHRGLDQFLADLKRTGRYDPDWVQPNRPMQRDQMGRSSRGVTRVQLRAIFEERPDHVFSLQELFIILKARLNADVPMQTIQNNVNNLMVENHVTRIGHGQYRRKKEGNGNGTAAKAVVVAAPVPVSTIMQAGQRIGDAQIDEQLERLDHALTALGDVEAVIRFGRDVLAQVAALKNTLAAFGGGQNNDKQG